MYETRHSGVLVAAKHLYHSSAQNHEKFKEEFKGLREVIHPNLVSYLEAATCPDPQSDTPTLVIITELMERNLTQFLGEAKHDIPIHLQVNLSLDISFALAYLHSQQIMHGNLRSNNVLLVGTTAKVADYGMAKLLDSQLPMRGPDYGPYLPPEAQMPHVQYSEKFDIYGLGVLIVQIATREKPSLIPQLLQTTSAEMDRSHQLTVKIATTHPLRDIALQCLKDSPKERPTAQNVARRLGKVKHHKLYVTSLKQEKEVAQQEFVQLQEIAKSREEVVVKQRQENQKIQKANEQLLQQLNEKDQTISTLQATTEQQCQKHQTEMQLKAREIVQLAASHKQKLSRLDTLTQQQLKDKDKQISALHSSNQQQCRELQHQLSTLKQKHQEELEKKKEEILHLSSTMTRQSAQLKSQIKQLQKEIQERDKKNSELHQTLDQTLQQLKVKEKLTSNLENAAAQQRQTLEAKAHEIANLKQRNQREMQQKERELTQLTSKSKQQVSQLEAQTHQLRKVVQEKRTEISKLTSTVDSQLQKIKTLDTQISDFRSEKEKQATELECWEGEVKGALESLSSAVNRRKLMHVKKEPLC